MPLVLLSVAAGVGIGLGWRVDSLAWTGVLGFSLFLTGQFYCRRLWQCLALGLVTGYLAYFTANPWILSTVEGLMDSQSLKTRIVVHAVHLIHGGLYGMFAVGWWTARKFLRSGWILAPAIWLILESTYPALFSMRQGCLLLGVEPLIQIASVFGAPAVTLQLFALASLLPLILCWLALSRSEIDPVIARRWVVGILVLTVVNFSWGSHRINRLEKQRIDFAGERLNVAIIQGDTEYATFHINMMKRSRKYAGDCELVLWPECSLGKYNRTLTEFADAGLVAVNGLGMGYQFQPFPDPQCHLLAAGYSWTRKPGETKLESKYVSAYLFDPDEKMVGRHDKIELMAGGEYIPGDTWFPPLARWLTDDEDPNSIRLSRGTVAAPIGEVKQTSIGVMLCCEDMSLAISRDMTKRGADLLVCLANGMCFDSEIVLRQHFAISRFRAIENNRYFMRCGSFGVTCLISPTGKVLDSVPCFKEADLRVSVPIEDRPLTLFNRFGDTLTWISYLMVIGFAFNSMLKRSTPESA